MILFGFAAPSVSLEFFDCNAGREDDGGDDSDWVGPFSSPSLVLFPPCSSDGDGVISAIIEGVRIVVWNL